MTTTIQAGELPTLTITEEIFVRASIETTFASLLEQLGPLNQTPDGKPLSMVLEARPGGRWYRDLGADHFDRRDKAKLAHRLIQRLQALGFAVEARAA